MVTGELSNQGQYFCGEFLLQSFGSERAPRGLLTIERRCETCRWSRMPDEFVFFTLPTLTPKQMLIICFSQAPLQEKVKEGERTLPAQSLYPHY